MNVCLKNALVTATVALFFAACGDDSSSNAGDGASVLKDSRDGKTYEVAQIGDQLWMTENLNYATSGENTSWCFEDDEANCEKYGRYYTWKAAIDACPSGWRLPKAADFRTLLETLGSKQGDERFEWVDVGSTLKSTSGWMDLDSASRNGSNESGFNVLAVGYALFSDTVSFFDEHLYARFWTSDEPLRENEGGFLSVSYEDEVFLGSRYPPNLPGKEIVPLANIRCIRE